MTFKKKIAYALQVLFILAATALSVAVLVGFEETKSQHRVFYMYKDVGRLSEYGELLQALRTASSSDTIEVHFSGYGGDMLTVQGIIGAAEGSKAHTIAVIDTSVFSADATIPLGFKEIKAAKGVVLMFHHHSGYRQDLQTCGAVAAILGVDGKACVTILKAKPDWFTFYINDRLSKFLTKDEIETIFEGGEVYIPATRVTTGE